MSVPVAGYIRVSTDGQAEHGWGLPEQRAKVEEHCRRKGYTLVELAADEGVSGTLAERPGLRRLLALAEAGAIKAVVTPRVDRIGRRTHVIHTALHNLRSCGLRVEFIETPTDNTPAGRLMEATLAGVAEFHWELVRENTMDGRRKKAEQTGRHPQGVAPYAYRCVSVAQARAIPEFAGRDGEYLVVEDEARIVQELFRRAATGETLSALSKWTATTGGRRLSRSTILKILANPIYYGAPRYRRSMQVDTPQGKKRVDRPEEEQIVLTAPALVDEATFHAVAARLAENAATKRGRPSLPGAWPLRGVVRCGVCKTEKGHARTCCGNGGRRGEFRRYVCTSKSAQATGGAPFCGTRILAETLEDAARDALRRAATPGRLAQVERKRALEAAKAAGDPQARAQAARRELERLDDEENAVADLALQGFSRRVVEERLAGIQARRAAAQAALAQARAAARTTVSPEEAAAKAETQAALLRDALPHVLEDPAVLAEWARLLLRITLHPDREPEVDVQVP